MPPRFNGPLEFTRQDSLPYPRLLEHTKVALLALVRAAPARLKAKAQETSELVVPEIERMESIGAESLASPRQVRHLRLQFDARHRDGARSEGRYRIAIESVTILLRLLELRTTAIVEGLDPPRLAGLQARLGGDLWCEPAAVKLPTDPDFDWRELPRELHRAWLARLTREWETLNWYYLDRMLRPPIFELSESRVELGNWHAERRVIAVSGWHIATHAWSEVVETLKHEIAHQMVSEVWRKQVGRIHGPEFRTACARLRCDSRASVATGTLERVQDSQDPTDRIVSRIKKLLALGQSPNQHEAALAMERASELLARFNLDGSQLRQERSFLRRFLGPVLARREEHHHTLARILSDHFFVRIIWDGTYVSLTDSDGSRMEVIGTQENLDVSEYVYDYLTRTIHELWAQHRASDAFKGGRKSQFLAGLTRGFLQKLQEQKTQLVKEQALVYKQDTRLEAHVAHLYPRLRHARISGVSRSEDYHIGVEQGREITLRMGVTERSGNRVGLLGPGRGEG